MTAAHQVNWTRCAPQPLQALVILDCDEHSDMTTIAHRGADGQLYGCRDVTHGEKHDAIVQAWMSEACDQGIVCEDARTAPAVRLGGDAVPAVEYTSVKSRTSGQRLIETYATADEAKMVAQAMRDGGHDAVAVMIDMGSGTITQRLELRDDHRERASPSPVARLYWSRLGDNFYLHDQPAGTARGSIGGVFGGPGRGYQGLAITDIHGDSSPSAHPAMRSLEAAIERRSIGLFNLDRVEFVQEWL